MKFQLVLVCAVAEVFALKVSSELQTSSLQQARLLCNRFIKPACVQILPADRTAEFILAAVCNYKHCIVVWQFELLIVWNKCLKIWLQQRLEAVSYSLSQKPRRIFRRSKSHIPATNKSDRLRNALLEYGYSISKFDSALAEEQPVLSTSPHSNTLLPVFQQNIAPTQVSVAAHPVIGLPELFEVTVPAANAGKIVEFQAEGIRAAAFQYVELSEGNSAHQHQVRNLEKQITGQEAHIERLQIDANAAESLRQELDGKCREQLQRRMEHQAAIGKLQDVVDSADVGAQVKALMDLLERLQILEKEEGDFRTECRRKRAEMQSHIHQLKYPDMLPAQDDKYGTEVENAYNADLQKWNLTRTDLSERYRAVALLQRRLDEMPSQTELMQYERRFVELYLHVQRKLRETRKYYATYNALAEANELTLKEISLLNSIHSQFEAAMMTTGGRSKFVESMDAIAKGVQQKLDKIQRRFESEQSKLSVLKEKHATAVAAQRNYYALVKIFQEECARSEKLLAALESAA